MGVCENKEEKECIQVPKIKSSSANLLQTSPLYDARRGKKLGKTVLQTPRDRVVVVVVARPFPRDGGMAEDHGAQEAG